MINRAEPIDLRSDTVTKPTPEMRKAMYEAEVADDTYDGDPTVIRLQEMTAEKLGLEAALFVVSGTMGNLLGVLINTQPGQEVILGDQAHLFLWEVGSIARIGGCITHTIPFHDGWLDPVEVEMAIRPVAREAAQTGLICVENTSNLGGGSVITSEHLAKINHVARRYDLPIHMDGARFFNAVVASRRRPQDFLQYVDTISFCLSKGLGAPFGAMLCGSKDLIEHAISFRQMLGGGLRQAGVMAAAGIVALQTGIDRLEEDHAHAQKLAQGLAERFPGCCDPTTVQTNMVYVYNSSFGISGQELADSLAAEGVLVFPGEKRVRLTTHRMITSDNIDEVLCVFDRLAHTLPIPVRSDINREDLGEDWSKQ